MAAISRESVQDTLDNLIEQFSDVYCFYRELIQNSLDAGTNRVDVYLEFKPDTPGGDEGVMIIHVDDYGEGMNRDIIDNQLTRLFSSSKENDLTKIGKFGIGFVSVFAIKPEVVSIDTSRDGQDWRIVFHSREEFQRMKRDYPVDGTKIQLFKACNKKFFDFFSQRSKETVIQWCKHSEAEIYFQDELVNQPYDVDSPCKIKTDEQAGEVVAGYTGDREPFYGFYNQGLTLIEGRKNLFPGITFKIKSKYLEHTLTRDNIREDENYWKAIELLNDIVKKRLPVRLFSMIEEEIQKDPQTPESDLYRQIILFAKPYLEDPSRMPGGCRERKIAGTIGGGFVTVQQLTELLKTEEILYDYSQNLVTEAFEKQGRTVIRTVPQGDLLLLMETISGQNKKTCRPVHASAAYFKPPVISQKDYPPGWKSLLQAVDGIVRKMSARTEPICFADFTYPGSCIAHMVYVLQDEPGQISGIGETSEGKVLLKSLFSVFSRRKTLVLNTGHPYVQKLLLLAERDTEMAAYFLTKLLYLDDGIDTVTDQKIAAISLEGRKA